MSAGLIYGALAALPWILQLPLAAARARFSPGLPPATPDAESQLTVIVPMRNEEVNVNGCLAAVFGSRPAPHQVIVVDDESTDGTSALLRVWARTEPKLLVIKGEALAAGWIGKPWALVQGARQATGSRLLFIDADTRVATWAFNRAEGYMKESEVALLSLEPRQILGTASERIIMPIVFTLIALRYPDLDRMNQSITVRDGAANGQFIMVDRTRYERVGGHGAVRGEVVEDLRLAQAFRRAGERTHILDGRDVVSTRMYRSLGGLIEGWSKNLALGSRQSLDDSAMATFAPWGMALCCIALWVLPTVVLLGIGVRMIPDWALGWALPAFVGNWLFWGWAAIAQRSTVRWSITHALGALSVAGLVLNSLRLRQRIRWKGRSYSTT